MSVNIFFYEDAVLLGKSQVDSLLQLLPGVGNGDADGGTAAIGLCYGRQRQIFQRSP